MKDIGKHKKCRVIFVALLTFEPEGSNVSKLC
jgi:hypothetical protein